MPPQYVRGWRALAPDRESRQAKRLVPETWHRGSECGRAVRRDSALHLRVAPFLGKFPAPFFQTLALRTGETGHAFPRDLVQDRVNLHRDKLLGIHAQPAKRLLALLHSPPLKPE